MPQRMGLLARPRPTLRSVPCQCASPPAPISATTVVSVKIKALWKATIRDRGTAAPSPKARSTMGMPRMMVLEKAALIPKMAGAAPVRANSRRGTHGRTREHHAGTREVGEHELPFGLRRQLGARQRAQQHDRDGEVEGEQGQAAGGRLVEGAQPGGQPADQHDAEDRRDDLDDDRHRAGCPLRGRRRSGMLECNLFRGKP